MGNELSLSNVIDVSLVPTASGLSEFKTSNVLLLSTEIPVEAFEQDEEFRVYRGPVAVNKDFGVDSLTAKMANAIFSQAPNILSNSGVLIIGLKGVSESQAEAYLRLRQKALFCGFLTTDTIANDIASNYAGNDSSSASDALVSSLVNAENNKINFIVSNVQSDIDDAFAGIKNATLKKTRCLFYGGTETEAKIMMAAYVSKAMSTVFEGSNTTQTMHLKPLVGVTADPIMTETLLEKCKTAGVDSYVSIAGVPCVFSTGANGFFDEVFNELWFVNALQTAGFNYLRQTGTKIPQTEAGMTGLKSVYMEVCSRAVNNGFIAPGKWNSPDTFGDPTTFKNNIANLGYYVYSLPVAQQSQSDREERKAPLVQIAVKAAGAIHSTNIIVNINL